MRATARAPEEEHGAADAQFGDDAGGDDAAGHDEFGDGRHEAPHGVGS